MSKANILELNYTDDLLVNYQKLVNLPGFVLLESSDKTGRYDILSAYPYKQIKLTSDSADLSEALASLQGMIPSTASPLDLPFQGGAIGYFSYDLALKLAGIEARAQPTLAGMPLADLGFYDWALIVDHHLKKIRLVAQNTRLETTEIVAEVLGRWQSSPKDTACFRLKAPFSPLISKEDYRNAFYDIYKDLCQGRAYQVNYTQPFNASYLGDPWLMYRQVRANNPVPFSAFLRTQDADILSFSPERFLLMSNRKLLASPIKGTEIRSSNPQEDRNLYNKLLSCAKNKAENVMIVDLLRNDLGRIAQPGSVRVTDLCAIESYQSVHHLVSHIEALCLPEISPIDAFLSCFPGGSITGAPKLEAMRIIAEQEPYARGVYCGSIGYFSSHGRFDTNIAIRTVIAREETLHMAAGGGIIIDSQWEDEYVECFTKISAIVNGMNGIE